MENDVDKLRKEIAKRYEDLCRKRGVPKHNKLYLNLIEPIGANPGKKDGGKETQVVSVSLVYRGNYKVYFNDRIKDQDFEVLCEVLVDFADLLAHLDFSYNHLTAKSARALGKVLEAAVKLESLNLQYNSLEAEGCQVILDSLTQARNDEDGNSSLAYLNLAGNDVRSEGVLGIDPDEKLFKDKKSKVENFLSNNKDLLELNLANNKVDELGMIEVLSQFNSDNNATALAVLVLDNPHFGGPSQTTAFHIGRMLQSKYCQIEKLSLRQFALTDDGLSIICEHLITKEETKLRVLDLGANQVTFKGCLALANVLKAKNCILESLVLDHNRVGYFGARALGAALEANKTLVHLDLTTNDITDDGLFLLAQSLQKNDSLFSLKLYFNHFGPRAKAEFYELLRAEHPGRTSDWFLDFTVYKVDDQIQIALVDNQLPYDIAVPRKYFVAADLPH